MGTTSERKGTTRLGRAVRATADGAAVPVAANPDRARQTNWLRDVILGGQDGLVNILGIILGVIAGGGSNTVLIVAGFAAAITESISMGAVGYTSSMSERDYYQAEQTREKAAIAASPAAERDEIRAIYAAKGFEGKLLDDVVATITANRETWLTEAVDTVNAQFGEFTITFATSLPAKGIVKQKIPFGSTRYFELLCNQA